MSTKSQMILAGSRAGRVILHVAALIRDGRYFWHLAGITRELRLI